MYLGEVNTAAPHNAKGNRENEKLRDFHDLMITSRGFDWKTPPERPIEWSADEKATILEILRPFAGKTTWGFKDPRTIWLLEGYLKLFPTCRLIAPFRHPSAVAKSLNARRKGLQLPLEQGRWLWRRTNERLLCIRNMHTLTLLHFGIMGVSDPLFSKPFNRFARSVGLTEKAVEFYDRDLVHHDGAVLEMDAEDRELWQRLLAAIQEGS